MAQLLPVRSLWTILIFALSAGSALGDAIPISDGRYTGPATLVPVSTEQLEEIGLSRRVQLTQAQRDQLVRSGQPAPSTLEVLAPQEARAQCTCHTANIAIWLTRKVVQVPHAFLRSDDDPVLKLFYRVPSAEPLPPLPLKLIGDVDGRLRVDGRIVNLNDLESLILMSQPPVDHIIVLMPPPAADIPVSRKQRKRIYQTTYALATKYKTSFGYFE
jgi:hypothetical protein